MADAIATSERRSPAAVAARGAGLAGKIRPPASSSRPQAGMCSTADASIGAQQGQRAAASASADARPDTAASSSGGRAQPADDGSAGMGFDADTSPASSQGSASLTSRSIASSSSSVSQRSSRLSNDFSRRSSAADQLPARPAAAGSSSRKPASQPRMRATVRAKLAPAAAATADAAAEASQPPISSTGAAQPGSHQLLGGQWQLLSAQQDSRGALADSASAPQQGAQRSCYLDAAEQDAVRLTSGWPGPGHISGSLRPRESLLSTGSRYSGRAAGQSPAASHASTSSLAPMAIGLHGQRGARTSDSRPEASTRSSSSASSDALLSQGPITAVFGSGSVPCFRAVGLRSVATATMAAAPARDADRLWQAASAAFSR